MGYTRSELLDRISSEEITLWVAEYTIRAEEDKQAQKGKGKNNKLSAKEKAMERIRKQTGGDEENG